MSLTCFLDDLLKSKHRQYRDDLPTTSTTCCSKITIVDDNAQLTEENRLKNSMSFASAGSSHRVSRWSSQPSISTSAVSPIPAGKSRRSSTSSCYPRRNSKTNATWEDVRVQPSLLLASSASMTVFPTKPLHINHPNSNSEVSAPSIPRRVESPHTLKPKIDRQRFSASMNISDRSDSSEKSAKLRGALGAMAPKLSGSERSMVCERMSTSIKESRKKNSSSSRRKTSSVVKNNSMAGSRRSSFDNNEL